MSDVSLFFLDDFNRFDMKVEKGDLDLETGLRTAVTISLFTNRRVTELEVPVGEKSRRGWWADAVAEVEGDRIGSKLWLLDREKQTVDVLERAREYAEEALAWLVEDGVAESVSVSTTYPSRGILRLEIEIVRPNKQSAALSYDYAWEGEAKLSTG
jgi:phage gp46-like protein